MRVLVFCDDTYHPAATVRAGLAPLAQAGGFDFDWIEDAAGWNPAMLRDYPVVLLSKSNVCSASNQTPWLAVAEGVGFAALTNPGASGDTPGTTFLRDNATTNSEGKFPGFLGGGPGTSPGGNPGPVLDFGTAWTELFFALSPTNDKPAAPWTATYLVGKAGAPMKNQASFKESKEFVSPAFNVAGLSVGPGDELLIRSLTIAVIGK